MARKIKLGDKEYSVNMSLGAQMRFKTATGKEFNSLKSSTILTVEDIAQMIYASLGPKPDITFEELIELVDGDNLNDVLLGALGDRAKAAATKKEQEQTDPLSVFGPISESEQASQITNS